MFIRDRITGTQGAGVKPAIFCCVVTYQLQCVVCLCRLQSNRTNKKSDVCCGDLNSQPMLGLEPLCLSICSVHLQFYCNIGATWQKGERMLILAVWFVFSHCSAVFQMIDSCITLLICSSRFTCYYLIYLTDKVDKWWLPQG